MTIGVDYRRSVKRLSTKTEAFWRNGEINGFTEIVFRSGCRVDFSTRCILEVSQHGRVARGKKVSITYIPIC